MSFEKIDLTNLEVDIEASHIDYSGISGLSLFPLAIDKLKTIEFSATSINMLNADLKRYYELIILYLNNDPRFAAFIDEFKSLSLRISRYSLTSSDYATLRDGIIELSNYLNDLSQAELYGEETGLYTNLMDTARIFQDSLRTIIADVDSKYSNLADDPLGKLIPLGSINENYLNEEIKETFAYIDATLGIYVDWNKETEEINTPAGLSKKPVVIKITK